MGKHTPGPWESGGCVVWGKDGDMVADLAFKNGRSPDSTEANARLIAAAPDLLDALRELLHETSDGSQMCGMPTLKRARAAIAKAEGRDE